MEEYMSRLKLYEKPDLSKVEEQTSEVYFYDPHAHLSTHEELLNDIVSIDIFRGWIADNAHLIKDKVVLDVGCGTGWFSILAAKAGAARVIGVEWSYIAHYTKSSIIKNNGMQDKITILKGNIENIELPDGIEKVDVIISQWIGYCLFQGGRIKKVLQARDRWLKEDGIIIPDQADLYIAGISDDEFRECKIEWWKNVYGFDMSSVIDETLRHAQYSTVNPDKIVTTRCPIRRIDLKNQSYDQIIAEKAFAVTARSNDFIQGFCFFFTVRSSSDVKGRELNTDPHSHPTHWRQTCFYFRDYFKIKRKELIQGSVSIFNINHDERRLGIIIGTHFEGELDQVLGCKTYVLRS